MAQDIEKSPLEKWIDAQKDKPDFTEALKRLVSYACAEWFRLDNALPVAPEEALSRVIASDLPDYPLGKWLDSPARFASEIADFCEKTKISPLPSVLKGDFPSVLDLRGVRCPANAARSRLVMSGLPEGASLDIYLDEGSPIENVPGALVADGHIVKKRQKKENFWVISVVKRPSSV